MKRSALREQIREWILQRIGDGEFGPGIRIRETAEANAPSVSPIPIREAIRELVVLGVLESAAHKGAWVKIGSQAHSFAVRLLSFFPLMEPGIFIAFFQEVLGSGGRSLFLVWGITGACTSSLLQASASLSGTSAACKEA